MSAERTSKNEGIAADTAAVFTRRLASPSQQFFTINACAKNPKIKWEVGVNEEVTNRLYVKSDTMKQSRCLARKSTSKLLRLGVK